MRNFDKQTLEDIFNNSNDRKDFVEKLIMRGLKSSTATIYWYNICKEKGIKTNEKRGRKKSKVDYKTMYFSLVNKIETEMEKAKQAKKSTTVFKHLLEQE